MPKPAALAEDIVLRGGSALLGAVLLGSAALSAGAALEHMTALAQICGRDAAPHCGWCLATAGFGLSALAAFGAALRAGPARQRA